MNRATPYQIAVPLDLPTEPQAVSGAGADMAVRAMLLEERNVIVLNLLVHQAFKDLNPGKQQPTAGVDAKDGGSRKPFAVALDAPLMGGRGGNGLLD
jgi:hypothetical protein